MNFNLFSNLAESLFLVTLAKSVLVLVELLLTSVDFAKVFFSVFFSGAFTTGKETSLLRVETGFFLEVLAFLTSGEMKFC